MLELKTLTRIALLIILYYVFYALYLGITNPVPAPGDSTSYHIPIAQSILNGTFIDPTKWTRTQFFAQLNPGSSEVFNALFLFLHLPMTLPNLFASIVLFFCCFFLARTFRLELYYSLLFAITISSLNVIARWYNAISIDVWMAVFFTLSIILLEKPQKSWMYYLYLGTTFGMLVGSKYSGWVFIFVLLLVYGRSLLSTINLARILVFLIPFSLLGLFWYVRNFLAVGNPMWPICLLSFPCKPAYEIVPQMWNTTLKFPIVMFNAFFGEYKLWGLSLLIPFYILYERFKKLASFPRAFYILSIIGVVNFLFLSIAPTSHEPWIMVSSFRYSYPMFIPLILVVFLLAVKYKKESWIGYFTIANMLPVLTMSYNPKLILVYLPFAVLCYYFLDRYEKKVTDVTIEPIKKISRKRKKR